mgnify:CR=1 FL=1
MMHSGDVQFDPVKIHHHLPSSSIESKSTMVLFRRACSPVSPEAIVAASYGRSIPVWTLMVKGEAKRLKGKRTAFINTRVETLCRGRCHIANVFPPRWEGMPPHLTGLPLHVYGFPPFPFREVGRVVAPNTKYLSNILCHPVARGKGSMYARNKFSRFENHPRCLLLLIMLHVIKIDTHSHVSILASASSGTLRIR